MKTSNRSNYQIPNSRLFIGLGVGVLALFVISSIWTAYSINQIMLNSVRLATVNISEGLANSVVESLVTKDYAVLEGNVRQTLANRNVLSAIVMDADGKIIVSLKRTKPGDQPILDFNERRLNPPQSRDMLYIQGADQIPSLIWQPIDRGVFFGWVKLEVAKTEIAQISNSLVLNGLIVLLLTLGSIVLYSIYRLRNYFSKVTSIHKNLSDENIQNSLEVIHSHIFMMASLGKMVALRDSNTGEHNFRVTYIAICIAEEMGLQGELMQSLIAGSFLHDIGKISIPDSILLKPTNLSPDEWAIMKTHVSHGEQIVKNMGWLSIAHEIVSHHHEKMDGTGYPRGISGSNIPISAKIFTLADCFDALCFERPYKKAFTYDEAMKILEQDTPNHFDPQIVSVFAKISKDIYEQLTTLDQVSIEKLVMDKTAIYFYGKVDQ